MKDGWEKWKTAWLTSKFKLILSFSTYFFPFLFLGSETQNKGSGIWCIDEWGNQLEDIFLDKELASTNLSRSSHLCFSTPPLQSSNASSLHSPGPQYICRVKETLTLACRLRPSLSFLSPSPFTDRPRPLVIIPCSQFQLSPPLLRSTSRRGIVFEL